MEAKPKVRIGTKKKFIETKSRLLVQFVSDNPFGGDLCELGEFKNFNEAVGMGITLIDNTVRAMLVNDGAQWVRIK